MTASELSKGHLCWLNRPDWQHNCLSLPEEMEADTMVPEECHQDLSHPPRSSINDCITIEEFIITFQWTQPPMLLWLSGVTATWPRLSSQHSMSAQSTQQTGLFLVSNGRMLLLRLCLALWSSFGTLYFSLLCQSFMLGATQSVWHHIHYASPGMIFSKKIKLFFSWVHL